MSRGEKLASASRLLWFHAFDRKTPKDVTQVLRGGPDPHPDPNTSTRRREIRLGIEVPCVYAYLGKTCTSFGQRALVLDLAALRGVVSPFDTGGLVEHIKPVCEADWNDQNRGDYISANTWPTEQLDSLLQAYPGRSVADYLDGHCPADEGPHARLPSGELKACIWNGSGNGWRAWTWEGRSTTTLRVGESLLGWTCSVDEFADLLAALEAASLDGVHSDADVLTWMDKYTEGGVSAIVAAFRLTQSGTYPVTCKELDD